jgi:hypothetical protein
VTILVVTEPFLTLATQAAKANGLPSARIAVVAHPLGGVSPGTVHARADSAVEQVVAHLTGASRE